jgi:hypothetical protein
MNSTLTVMARVSGTAISWLSALVRAKACIAIGTRQARYCRRFQTRRRRCSDGEIEDATSADGDHRLHGDARHPWKAGTRLAKEGMGWPLWRRHPHQIHEEGDRQAAGAEARQEKSGE